ncbi:SART-1 domain-containing protein [Cephalotus follicularis]|uniref:SART-1 domain-containing protein n=1 Tax=Cephalotus follicularis TaxID=3775 RepID=A0A1Q3D5L6_CEPFO|nr:SART-1 domain-containing protein [Cephalotus follicularis]
MDVSRRGMKKREKEGSRENMAKDRDYHDRDKYREKEQRDRKDRGGKEKERESEKERQGKEKIRDRDRQKERDKHKDRDRDRDKGRDQDKERLRDKDKVISKKRHAEEEEEVVEEEEVDRHRSKDDAKEDGQVNKHQDHDDEEDTGGGHMPSTELSQRISKMKEQRLRKKSEDVPEILAWVHKSRKIEEKKNMEKEKALQLSKVFEEQDNNVQGESEDGEAGRYTNHDLAGVKVLHGLDKVMEGGAVVLTLKDQSILADGDINQEVDMLENVEIGQQKQRDEAYKAAKKKTGRYDDKFNDDSGAEKKILPQYDDPAADEGVTLDARGRFSGEAEKKLEELRRRIEGASSNIHFENLNLSGKISSDYYTHEEMFQFKKPKKKKSLRKREKLDLDALEAEAVSAGLGVGDLGSRNDGRMQAFRKEQERSEAEMRSNSYKSAYAKAEEASKSLRMEQTLPVKLEEDEVQVIADDSEDLYKSLERARKLALKKHEEAVSGPQAIALLATTTASSQIADNENRSNGESQENKVVFTEMEEFVWGLQLDEEAHRPQSEDVFMDEDEPPITSEQEREDQAGGWTEVKDTEKGESSANKDTEVIVPDATIHEVAVGKGLSGALQLLKERGTLKESIDWGGRNMDKKKSKLVGIADNDGIDNRFKDIRIERTDEFGRIMTPKEAFRLISHKFHGKGPGKMKQDKRIKQFKEELKLKQMKSSDTPSLSVERMREAQAQLKTPYLVLSGHVKPGQSSDPKSGFATVEKDLPGGLTPMLGNRKVEHFLGINRKPEPEDLSTPKKPKP